MEAHDSVLYWTKFHSVIPRDVKFPTDATTIDVQKGGWWYLYFIDILLSEHKPAEYCWKIILILFPANTAILITSAEKTLGTSLTKKNMVVIPLTYS